MIGKKMKIYLAGNTAIYEREKIVLRIANNRLLSFFLLGV